MSANIVRKAGEQSWKYGDETAEKVYLVAEANTSGGRFASCSSGGARMVDFLRIKSNISIGKFLEEFTREFLEEAPRTEEHVVFNATRFNCISYAALVLQMLQSRLCTEFACYEGIGNLFKRYFVYNPDILEERSEGWFRYGRVLDLATEVSPLRNAEDSKIYACPPRCPLYVPVDEAKMISFEGFGALYSLIIA